MDGRARRTRDKHPPPRKCRELPFSGGVEQSLGSELLAQFPQRELKRADPFRLQFVDHELVTATRRVNINVAVTNDIKPIRQIELQPRGSRTPHNGTNLGLIIFERKIRM